MGKRPLVTVAVGLCLFYVGACRGSEASEASVAAPASTTFVEAPDTTSGEIGEVALFDVSPLVVQVRPGVVAVTQSQILRDVFGRPQEVPAGAGTGVVIGEGEILTNAHVVAGADSVLITTSDGDNLEAEVTGTAPNRDLALLSTESDSTLEALELGSSADLDVGNPVVAIGNALGIDAADLSVSVGIVSALDRSLNTPQGLLSGLIQTDAAINPGNSGGPLIDARGRVIGINTAIARNAQNVGFAIPIDGAVQVLDRLRSGLGEPYLGVSVVDNSPAVADQLELGTDRGAVVAQVAPDSPAAEAGIRRFDVIVRIGDAEIERSGDVVSALLEIDPDSEVSIEIVRGGDTITADVTVGTFPNAGR